MLPRRSASADLRFFESRVGTHLFVADGSRIYDLADELAQRARPLLAEATAEELWQEFGLGQTVRRWIDETVPDLPAPSAISLNVAQACNMACGYCYADEGRFGGKSRLMKLSVARQSIDCLLEESAAGATVLVGFMGGEPLLNRELIHEMAPYATARAEASGRKVRFSITTNGTLLTPEDAALFSHYPFSVQVSLDGDRKTNDAQRPMRDGSGSYEAILQGVALMKMAGRPQQLTARVTVTRHTKNLRTSLEHLIELGFDEVGFAPVLVSPTEGVALQSEDFAEFLEQMIECGRKCLTELKAGRAFPFSNLLTALEEIHRGTHRPYPCGAGAAYLSANAEGKLYACHRLVDDPSFAMGDVARGTDRVARREHLERSHVDKMEPCRSCWARYLCGGGCYHEVSRRGRVGCDYIRGWLEFCLGIYAELSAISPEGLFFGKHQRLPGLEEALPPLLLS